MGDKDLGEAISTGRKSQEAGGLWVLRPEKGGGLLLLLTCGARAEPQPRGRAAHRFPDGTSWRAGPRRALHDRWSASSPPLPGQVPGAELPSIALRGGTPACCGAAPRPMDPAPAAAAGIPAAPASPHLSKFRGPVSAARLSASIKIGGSRPSQRRQA